MDSLGRHILVEFYGCDVTLLNKASAVKEMLEDAARAARCTIVDSFVHQFSPYGVSGVVVIAESHLTIHTWPEYNYAAIDIFTCGEVIKPEVAASYLIDQFESKSPSVVEMKRGILSHENVKLPHKVSSGDPSDTTLYQTVSG